MDGMDRYGLYGRSGRKLDGGTWNRGDRVGVDGETKTTPSYQNRVGPGHPSRTYLINGESNEINSFGALG